MSELGRDVTVAAIKRALLQNWPKLILIAVSASIVSGIYSFIVPPTFRSETTLLPKKSAANSSMMGLIANMAGAGGSSLSGLLNSQDSSQLTEALVSRSLAERVISRLSLDKEFKGWKTKEDLVKAFRKVVKVVPPSLKSSVFTIQVDYKDPVTAQKIALTIDQELKLLLDEIGYNDATKNREFLQKQLDRNRDDLKAAEQRLADFQGKNPLVSLPNSLKSSLEELTDLESKRVQTGMGLKVAQETIDTLSKNVDSLQADPNSLTEWKVRKNTLHAQEQAIQDAQSDYLKKASQLPLKTLELARLQRDVQIQNTIYMVLTQQYETALIAESKDSDAFLVLDPPSLPEQPIKPKKRLNIMLGFGFGLIAGMFGIFASTLWKSKELEFRLEAAPRENVNV